MSDKLTKMKTSKPLPDYVDLFTFEEFKKVCEFGDFTDYDGSGYFATTEKYFTNLDASPSVVVTMSSPPEGITHVA